MESLPVNIREKAEAFAFRKLMSHFQQHPEVQNMETMTASGFCRNCLSKWLLAGFREQAPLPLKEPLTYDAVSSYVYGMPAAEWKRNHQVPASQEQIERYEASKVIHARHDGTNALAGVTAKLEPGPSHQKVLGNVASVKLDPCCPENTSPVSVGDSPVGTLLIPPPPVCMNVGILTVSDRASSGVYNDLSGPTAKTCLQEFCLQYPEVKAVTVCELVVPDEQEIISRVLKEWSSPEQGAGTAPRCNLVISTGGTGLGARDVTPEATMAVLDRHLPSLALEICFQTSRVEPMAFLSRGVCGIAGKTLVLNTPGAPRAVKQHLEIGLPLLAHAVSKLTTEL